MMHMRCNCGECALATTVEPSDDDASDTSKLANVKSRERRSSRARDYFIQILDFDWFLFFDFGLGFWFGVLFMVLVYGFGLWF